MSPSVVELLYNSKTHEFTVRVSKIQTLSYTLRYSTKGGTVEQAVVGKGKGDKANNFSATHLAGTESSGQKILHDVTQGVLEITSKDVGGQEVKHVKNFTVDEKGVIQVSDTSTNQVLGASTDSASLGIPSQNETYGLNSPAPLNTTKLYPSPMPLVATPVTTGTSTTNIMMMSAFGVAVFLTTLGGAKYLRNRNHVS
jgi:hypothetical protein